MLSCIVVSALEVRFSKRQNCPENSTKHRNYTSEWNMIHFVLTRATLSRAIRIFRTTALILRGISRTRLHHELSCVTLFF